MKIFIIALSLTASFLASASEQVPCSSVNLRAKKPGFTCTTSKGAIYERVSRDGFGEAWKGPDGIIWSQQILSGGMVSFRESVEACRDLRATIPSLEDTERGESNGFREVLTQMNHGTFWVLETFKWKASMAFAYEQGNVFVPGSVYSQTPFLHTINAAFCVLK